jgi:hypothetical protein
LASVFLLGFIVWAGLSSWASLQHKRANAQVTALLSGQPVTAENTVAALESINGALRFFPRHPVYLDLKGQILEYSADLPGLPGRERKQILEEAAVQYRGAIARRPLWPYSWSNLMSVKDKQGNIDGEYIKAFERSAELGPWEPRLQLQLIRSGLAHWPELGARQHELVSEVIDRAIQRQPGEMFAMIRAFNRPDLVCDQYPEQPRIQRYCRQVGW